MKRCKFMLRCIATITSYPNIYCVYFYIVCLIWKLYKTLGTFRIKQEVDYKHFALKSLSDCRPVSFDLLIFIKLCGRELTIVRLSLFFCAITSDDLFKSINNRYWSLWLWFKAQFILVFLCFEETLISLFRSHAPSSSEKRFTFVPTVCQGSSDPILYSKLLYKTVHYFLDIQYYYFVSKR